MLKIYLLSIICDNEPSIEKNLKNTTWTEYQGLEFTVSASLNENNPNFKVIIQNKLPFNYIFIYKKTDNI